MNITILTNILPYPLSSGGAQAQFNMIDALRKEHKISIVFTEDGRNRLSAMRTLEGLWPEVKFFPFRYARQMLYPRFVADKAVRALKLKLIPDSVRFQAERALMPYGVYFSADFKRFVNRIVRETAADIVQVEFYELISLVYVLPEDVQTVFVHHEPRFVHNANEMQLFREVTPMDRLQFGVARDYERSALSHYKHLIALTEVDRQVLTDFLGHGEHIHVSPAMVKRPEQPGSFQPAVHHRLTFVGSEDHCPNLDAVNWFCHDIIPLLREKGFRFTLQVIGNWRSQYVHDLCKACPELELTGFVDDLHTFLQGSIALVPIRIGAGMRMKIMDAVSAGVPFVTTSKGVEGLDFRDGEECLIADTATGFAEAVVRLSDDPALQECLSKQADGRLRQLYDPDQVLATRLSIYNTL